MSNYPNTRWKHILEISSHFDKGPRLTWRWVWGTWLLLTLRGVIPCSFSSIFAPWSRRHLTGKQFKVRVTGLCMQSFTYLNISYLCWKVKSACPTQGLEEKSNLVLGQVEIRPSGFRSDWVSSDWFCQIEFRQIDFVRLVSKFGQI